MGRPEPLSPSIFSVYAYTPQKVPTVPGRAPGERRGRALDPLAGSQAAGCRHMVPGPRGHAGPYLPRIRVRRAWEGGGGRNVDGHPDRAELDVRTHLVASGTTQPQFTQL